jgi:DNA-binding NarL/FixJ family response regulator
MFEISVVFWFTAAWTKKTQEIKRLAQLHERRKQVVRLHRKGHRVMQIAELTGFELPDGSQSD